MNRKTTAGSSTLHNSSLVRVPLEATRPASYFLSQTSNEPPDQAEQRKLYQEYKNEFHTLTLRKLPRACDDVKLFALQYLVVFAKK